MMRRIIVLLLLCNAWNSVAQVSLDGIVVNENGIPIENALVVIVRENSSFLTNIEGYFSHISATTIDSIHLNVSCIGFSTLDSIFNLDSLPINIILLKNINLPEIMVNAYRTSRYGSASMISSSRINNDIVLLGEPDINKSLQLLSGVNFSTEGTSDIVVRGGNVGENLSLIDGQEAFLGSHLLGLVSPIPTSVIDGIEFFKGGYPAEFTGKLSSITNVKSLDFNRINLESKVSVGLLSSSLFHSQKFNNKFAVVSSFRFSNINLLLKPISYFQEGESIIPSFYDGYLKTIYEFNENNYLSLQYLAGSNKFNVKSQFQNSNNTTTQKESNSWVNNFLNVKYSKISENYHFESNVTFTNYNSGNAFSSENVSSNETLTNNFRYENDNHLLNFSNKFTFFIDFMEVELGNALSTRAISYSELDNEKIDETATSQYYSNSFLSINLGSKKTTSSIGLHAATFLGNEVQTFLEPRIYLDYLFGKNIIYASYSVINQPVHLISNRSFGNYLKISVLANASAIPMARSQLFSIGYKLDYPQFTVNTELYYKKRSNLLSITEGDQYFITSRNIGELLTDGNGVAKGLEITINSTFKSKNAFNLSYSLSSSVLQFSLLNSGETFDDYFDRRHSLNFQYNRKFSKEWDGFLSFVFLSGVPFSAYHATYPGLSYENGDSNSGIPNNILFHLESLNNTRLPNYHRLDLAANRQWKRKNVTCNLKFGIYNIYARTNPFAVRLSTLDSTTTNANNLQYEIISYFNFIPFINYTVNFHAK